VAFILSNQREDDVIAASERYRDYLESVRSRFPASAFALATSDWYFGFDDPRAPHDAHLQSVTVSEIAAKETDASPVITIRIRLLSAHGGIIEFIYPQVFCYNLVCNGSHSFHSDWRYDEFRLSDSNHVLHEIEWWHGNESGRWLIESSDVQHQWFATENT
jgi:hypothetical protein